MTNAVNLANAAPGLNGSGTNVTVAGDLTVSGGMVPSSSFQRNRFINGDMRITQRGSSFTPGAGLAAYTLDRWEYNAFNATGAYSVAQSSVVPNGNFTNSALLTVTTPATPSGTDYYFFQQKIEGFNIADLGWGTANAQSVTVSFWVRSSVTGTYGFHLINAATTLSYVATYTISAANTWQYVTLTVPGPTTGTWNTTNGVGIFAGFDLGAGASRQTTANTWASGASFFSATSSTVNWISTNGATFYLTGVQLEVGSVATPFERRLYSQELMLAQRYYELFAGSFGWIGGGSTRMPWSFKATKRTTPTVSFSNIIYNNSNTLGTLGSNGGDAASISCNATTTAQAYVDFSASASAEL